MTTKSRTARGAALVAVLSAVAVPVGLSTTADAASAPTVKLKGMQFSPRSITIKKGGQVKFVWAGGGHNLVGPMVRTSVVSKGTKVLSFKKAGSFKYICQVHPGMSMTVKVK